MPTPEAPPIIDEYFYVSQYVGDGYQADHRFLHIGEPDGTLLATISGERSCGHYHRTIGKAHVCALERARKAKPCEDVNTAYMILKVHLVAVAEPTLAARPKETA